MKNSIKVISLILGGMFFASVAYGTVTQTFINPVPLANGGTNATTAAAALTNLGGISTSTYNTNFGTMANVNSPVPIVNGGTGATSSAAALTALGGISTSTYNGNFGTMANVNSPVPVANGGTNATSAAAALTSLGAYAASNPTAYVTSTGANPTATASGAAVNGTANTFMRSDGAPALDNKFSSSTLAFNIPDATTTSPYNMVLLFQAQYAVTVAEIGCHELAAGTTTLIIFRGTDFTSPTAASNITSSTIVCGPAGATTTTFTTSTIPAGTAIWSQTTSTAGTTQLTDGYIYLKK